MISRALKIFIPYNSWFTLRIPEEWEEYEDDDENTYAFFNPKTWTGNFRITPFLWTEETKPDENKAGEFIVEEILENEGAFKIQIGDFNCAHYKKNSEGENGELIVYYWSVGKKNELFICSFAIDKKQEYTKLNKMQLEIIENVLKSIAYQ